MFNNRYLFSYERASLPLKISLPFIAMFLVLGVVGTVVFGQRFSNQLDREQREKAEELAALVKRDIDRELEDLRKNARLLTAQETIVESASAQNRIKLQQRILPLKAVLKTDIITIINPKKDILLNVKTNELQNKELMYETAVELLIEGSGLHTVVASSDSGPPILIGTAPLKNEQNIIGGIIVGTVVSDTLLAQISESINVQIVAIYEEKIVASALPIAPGDAASLSSITSQSPVVLGAKEFIAEPVNLNSLDEQQFRLIILVSRQPFVAAKQNLWLSILTVAFIGSVMVALAGYWIARKIAEPIQKITHTARKVVKDNDFNLRAEVATEDEIGTLANSLNQLIGWVEQYTHELEVAGQTLEDRV